MTRGTQGCHDRMKLLLPYRLGLYVTISLHISGCFSLIFVASVLPCFIFIYNATAGTHLTLPCLPKLDAQRIVKGRGSTEAGAKNKSGHSRKGQSLPSAVATDAIS